MVMGFLVLYWVQKTWLSAAQKYSLWVTQQWGGRTLGLRMVRWAPVSNKAMALMGLA